MLLLHSIIFLGALIMCFGVNSNPWVVDVESKLEESDDPSWLFRKFPVKALQRKTDNAKVCQTEVCRLTGQAFLRNLNESVDPCEDFYEYACGGWAANNPIPAAEVGWNEWKIVNKKNNERIREILEAPERNRDIPPMNAAKQFYQSCMNLDAIEKTGIKPLEIILEENGGWPMIMEESEWNRSKISWQQIQDNYLRLNVDAALFRLTILSTYRDPDVNFLMLRPLDLILPMTMVAEQEEVQVEKTPYAEYVEEIALEFVKSRHSNVPLRNIAKDVADMINFAEELEELSVSNNIGGYKMTIHTLQKLYNPLSKSAKSKINWLKTINNLLRETDIRMKGSDKILLLNREYFLKLVGVLEKTSERTIVNYLHWRLVTMMVPFTNEKIRNINFAGLHDLYGIQEQKPRFVIDFHYTCHTTCSDLFVVSFNGEIMVDAHSKKPSVDNGWLECVSRNLLTVAVSYQFVQKYFTEKSKKIVSGMIKEIQDKVEIQISDSEWMDNETKSEAKQKLSTMKKFIGFPDWYKNVSAVSDFYKGLRVGPSYIDNVLNYKKFSLRKNLRKLGQPVDKSEWPVEPIAVNSFYDGRVNSLIFPAAIFQTPYFNASQLSAVNYGAIGTIIGHEISHAYNDIARDFDRNECFVDQFNEYEIKEVETINDTIFVNGDLTQRENIADSAGLQSTYEAYKSKLAAKGIVDDKLPGLEDFSDQQIFFLSFANIWCDSYTPTHLLETVNTKVHTIGSIRVIGTVSNTPGFSEAFQCPIGSPMNPEDKCNLW